MALPHFLRRSPQGVGVACAIGATMLGGVYLALTGAPAQLIAVNIAALVLGLAGLAALRHSANALRGMAGFAMLLAALVMLATPAIGETAEGASRWVALGPLFVQPSLILLPLMVVGFLHRRSVVATLAMLVAALAMALQPDRAMAGVLVVGLAAQLLVRPDRHATVALTGSLAAFLVALIRPDTVPAMPFVEQIYFTAFEVGLLAGFAVIGGTVLLLVPPLAIAHLAPEQRPTGLVFAAVWLATIAAALLGNYPTPVVGYSGAAVLGYVLSLFALSGTPSPSTGFVPERDQGQHRGQQDSGDEGLNLAPVSP